MDKNTVRALSQVLDDHLNERLKRLDAKQKINSILHNKSSATVIRELRNYISPLPGKDKNIATVIVIMAVLRRNLDSVSEVKEAVVLHGLVGHLYGGLYTLLASDSELLSIKVNLTDSLFENKYDYILRFVDFNYWDYIELFQAAKVLSLADSQKFEKLALMDKTKLILLNITSYHLSIEPSKELIDKLLLDEDELKQNIGLLFITRSISRCINDIDYIKRSETLGGYHGKNIRSVNRTLKISINECYTFLENCDKRTQVALLTNFLLVHQTIYPITFARNLVSSEFQDEFIYQISNTGKVKTLKDVAFLIGLISNTSAIGEDKKRISKRMLYMAIVNKIKSFIDDKKGIYGWDEQQSKYIEFICQRLPARCIRILRVHLTDKDRSLMSNKLDEMIRFHIYLEDKRQHEIISGIINAIDSLTL
ncbi:MAG: hypothetical protein VR72_12890 [Clostridiaceae bacterium BRH_c20a]|nr:MAG: hypothetical protein VR72_12890 [Clostridiaceae bacterium BRH_c20a]